MNVGTLARRTGWLLLPVLLVAGERILRGATDLKTLQGLIREARKKP